MTAATVDCSCEKEPHYLPLGARKQQSPKYQAPFQYFPYSKRKAYRGLIGDINWNEEALETSGLIVVFGKKSRVKINPGVCLVSKPPSSLSFSFAVLLSFTF